MISLWVAIASLGRAMQWQANNRKYLIAQDTAFLSRYQALRAADAKGITKSSSTSGVHLIPAASIALSCLRHERSSLLLNADMGTMPRHMSKSPVILRLIRLWATGRLWAGARGGLQSLTNIWCDSSRELVQAMAVSVIATLTGGPRSRSSLILYRDSLSAESCWHVSDSQHRNFKARGSPV